MKVLTTYEASKKYKISIRTLRQALADKRINSRSVNISKSRTIYLLEEKSLLSYLKNKPKRGRPAKKSA